MPKAFARVLPTVYLVKDGNGNVVRSDYSYPTAPSCTVHTLCWNKDQNPPNGDFLQEQLWAIEGPQESLDIFFADPRAQEVTPGEGLILGESWDGPKDIEDKGATLNAKIVCPICGMDLTCQMHGSVPPKANRRHKGFDPQDYRHHFGGDAVDAHLAGKGKSSVGGGGRP